MTPALKLRLCRNPSPSVPRSRTISPTRSMDRAGPGRAEQPPVPVQVSRERERERERERDLEGTMLDVGSIGARVRGRERERERVSLSMALRDTPGDGRLLANYIANIRANPTTAPLPRRSPAPSPRRDVRIGRDDLWNAASMTRLERERQREREREMEREREAEGDKPASSSPPVRRAKKYKR
ncbi:hypothetical protein KIPB_000119 [Kipferlia bialata]|uniref:Uncharacterized protein n=1 Tax=Kipferlia bialata TaxID=797122 RepID=A0A9K3CLS9_9EUKA|nr:hypothetical protein KIPB_000119 [Kipferlia bialata]|eukprot:g119.t1